MATDIATIDKPISISSAPWLLRCPWRWLLRYWSDDEFGGSVAADTGTACGRVIELYHRGVALEDAINITEAESKEGSPGSVHQRPFVKANWDKVELACSRYSKDPRNPVEVVLVESLEQEVSAVLPPHPDDPTGAPIHLRGHLDQLRRTEEGVAVWDIKMSKHRGNVSIHSYAMQLVCYAEACRQSGYDVTTIGGIISLQGYLSKTQSAEVFFPLELTKAAQEDLLLTLRAFVGELRDGYGRALPGEHCVYCPFGPLTNCMEVEDAKSIPVRNESRFADVFRNV